MPKGKAMFKTRILLAFVALALVAVAQGVIGYFAMVTASQNVQKGRVANELLVGYMDLLSNKQLLRTQLTSEMTGLESDPQQSQVYYYNMIRALDTLGEIAVLALAALAAAAVISSVRARQDDEKEAT